MAVQTDVYKRLISSMPPGVDVVAVSKTKSAEDIQTLYDLGQRDFGENYVQELTGKQMSLPADIRWHHIGHLQSNKVKYIAPFVHLIHAVDTYALLGEIHKQGVKTARVLDCLLQVHIAREETKFGFDISELDAAVVRFESERDQLSNVRIRGLMGMSTNGAGETQTRAEFGALKQAFDRYAKRLSDWDILSMGMSTDYTIAIDCGSTLVRIGSLLFGAR
jgi:PLP dependent protein